MTSSSSSSSMPRQRRSVYGVPTKCWCGNNLKTFASQTKENPFRRFHRCSIASQRESEDHLFKWEDEAILDEVRIVDAKRLDLLTDFQSLSNTVLEQLERQAATIGKLKEELALASLKINQLQESDNILRAAFSSPCIHGTRVESVPFKPIGVAIGFLGFAAWLCIKLS